MPSYRAGILKVFWSLPRYETRGLLAMKHALIPSNTKLRTIKFGPTITGRTRLRPKQQVIYLWPDKWGEEELKDKRAAVKFAELQGWDTEGILELASV